MPRASEGYRTRKLCGSSDFMLRGACRDADPELFAEEIVPATRNRRNPRFRAALSFCDTCSVLPECLAWAIENRETGIWGGTYLTNGKLRMAR